MKIKNGSTDTSVQVLREIQRRDPRVKIITQKNEGPSIARNRGFAEATGKYVIFLDADDFFEKNLLEKLYNIAEKDALDIAVSRFDIYNESKDQFLPATDEPHSNIFTSGGVTSGGEHPAHILQSTTGYVWNKLFRLDFLKNKEISFDPELFVFEDVHFVATAISLAERVERVEEVLIHHRVYSEQSRARSFRKYYSQIPVVYKKIKQFLMKHGMYIPLAKSYLNLSSTRCHKIFNLLWADGKEKFWDSLHFGYAEEFGWYRHEKEDFDSREVYEFVPVREVLRHYRPRLHRARLQPQGGPRVEHLRHVQRPDGPAQPSRSSRSLRRGRGHCQVQGKRKIILAEFL